MGFWSGLGKVLGVAAPFVAAPFTGGTSLLGTLGMGAKTAGLIGAGMSTAGRLASGASKQRAEDRGAQTEFDYLNNQNYNNAMQARTGQQNTQALQYAGAKRDAESARMRQLASADMLGSFQGPTDPRASKFALNQMSPEMIAMMRDRAMKALESGSDVPQMQNMPEYRDTQMAQPGKADSFLSALNLGGTVLGGLRESGLFGNGQPQQGQQGTLTLPQVPVGTQPDDERPWWLKQQPQTMARNNDPYSGVRF